MHNSQRQNHLLVKFGSTAFLFTALISGLAAFGCNKTDSSTGPVIDPNAPITLISPKGGETFHVGDTMWVKWTVKDDPVSPITAVDLMISADSGKTWGYAKSGSVADDVKGWGNFPYVVSSTTDDGKHTSLISARCKFRVQLYATLDVTKMATSPTTFTILAK